MDHVPTLGPFSITYQHQDPGTPRSFLEREAEQLEDVAAGQAGITPDTSVARSDHASLVGGEQKHPQADRRRCGGATFNGFVRSNTACLILDEKTLAQFTAPDQ